MTYRGMAQLNLTCFKILIPHHHALDITVTVVSRDYQFKCYCAGDNNLMVQISLTRSTSKTNKRWSGRSLWHICEPEFKLVKKVYDTFVWRHFWRLSHTRWKSICVDCAIVICHLDAPDLVVVQQCCKNAVVRSSLSASWHNIYHCLYCTTRTTRAVPYITDRFEPIIRRTTIITPKKTWLVVALRNNRVTWKLETGLRGPR